MFLTILGGFISLALAILGITAVSNFLFFPRLKATQPAAQPKLSVLIPARNETAVIGQTIRALLGQTYPHFELILLDDQSDDGTGTTGVQAANGDARFRLMAGAPLPPGWLGKNWACHQLSQAATGGYLLFADADVRYDFQGSDPDTLQSRLFIPRVIGSPEFDTLFAAASVASMSPIRLATK